VTDTSWDEEWRSGLADMDEVEREQSCHHTFRSTRTLVCPDCGDKEQL
jgi:hypothetical protein